MTPEQEKKVIEVINNYKALRFALKDNNYSSTPHTYSTMIKVGNVLKQMYKSDIFKLIIDKHLPEEYKGVLVSQ